MATSYYGDTIGDASRSEERALERRLNLMLANRQFAAQQQQRRDAIEAQNAANAMNADRLGLSLDADARNQAYNRAAYADERRLDLEDRDYQRKQDAEELKLGLDEAEKQRQLTRELNDLRADNYIQRLQQSEDTRTFSDLAKRIAADDIRDIPALQDAEGGRLGSEEWVDLKTRLGQRQQRMMEESAMGPERAAQEATLALLSDPSFAATASDPAMRRYAIDSVMNRLGQNPAFRGKITPDYAAGKFNPVLGYKYSGPRDAIDWYGTGTTPRNPVPQEPPPPPAAEPSLMRRLGSLGLDAAFAGPKAMYDLLGAATRPFRGGPSLPPGPSPARLGISEPVVDRPMSVDTNQVNTPLLPTPNDPMAKAQFQEWVRLVRSGMSQDEASLVIRAKYQNVSRGPVRTY